MLNKYGLCPNCKKPLFKKYPFNRTLTYLQCLNPNCNVNTIGIYGVHDFKTKEQYQKIKSYYKKNIKTQL